MVSIGKKSNYNQVFKMNLHRKIKSHLTGEIHKITKICIVFKLWVYDYMHILQGKLNTFKSYTPNEI